MPFTSKNAEFRQTARVLAVLAVPLIYFLIPLVEGRAWNALGPYSFQILNPPEGYTGPLPTVPITAESWGACTVEIPFRARLNNCLRNLEMPLWNPYQGLGQPFAAQGEGCPYSPVEIVRVLLPYTYANAVTLSFCFAASTALYALLRGMTLSRAASTLGAWAFLFSGALTLNLARNNLSDQVCMIPILFWAAERAIRLPSLSSRTILAGVACLHLVGGFIQIAMSSALLCSIFFVFYSWLLRDAKRSWVSSAAVTLLYFTFGNGLAGFSLLPQIAAMQHSFSKNPEMLSMIPMPYANAIALFFPQLFGKYFESWIPGSYPQVVDWDNLFAFAGTLVAMLVVVGWSASARWPKAQDRMLFIFFSLTGVFLILRYISFPPVAFLNLLPIIGRQSPKHANGLTVFCFVVAAAFVVDSLRFIWSTRAHVFLAVLVISSASCVITLVNRQGGWAGTNLEMARNSIMSTLLVVAIMWVTLSSVARTSNAGSGIWAVAVMAVAELLIYVPMGTKTDDFYWARYGMFCATTPVAYLILCRRYRAATAAGAIGLGFYALFLVPRSNLPTNIDLTQAPRSVVWLRKHAENHARSWGIQPDFSSIAKIQDLGAVGPLAPVGFANFAKITGDERTYGFYRASTYYLLGGSYGLYPLTLYSTKKAIFDAAGLRYLYLNKEYFGFGKRFDESPLLQPPASLSVAYEDDRVKILESHAAQPKLRFFSNFLIEPDETAIIERLQSDPSAIDGLPMLAATDSNVPKSEFHESRASIQLLSYRANSVQVRLASSGSGILLLNDVFDRGWHVNVDGIERPLLQVNGLFRGVYIVGAGSHGILFYYRPMALVRGIILSLVVLAYLLVGLLLSYQTTCSLAVTSNSSSSEHQGTWTGVCLYNGVGLIVALGILGLVFATYFYNI